MFLLGSGLLAPAAAAIPAQDPCDLKKVENGLYCDECKKILEPDDIADQEYCKKCKDEAEEAGKEATKARKVKVCVKEFFACEQHPDETSREEGKCPTCSEELKKRTDKALVVYKCEECGTEGDKEGPCDQKDCKEKNKKVVATCSKSGTFPHVKE